MVRVDQQIDRQIDHGIFPQVATRPFGIVKVLRGSRVLMHALAYAVVAPKDSSATPSILTMGEQEIH